MKKKYKWILLALTVIAIVGLVISLVLNKNNNSNTINIDESGNEIYKFKMFEYTVPDGLKFSDYDTKHFKIEGNGWYALVGMWYDKTQVLNGDVSAFQKIISEQHNGVSGKIITVDGVDVVAFAAKQPQAVLCYFATDFNIDYEVLIFNDDGSYKTDALNELIEPLLNVTYKENDSEEFFYIGYFYSKEEEQKK